MITLTFNGHSLTIAVAFVIAMTFALLLMLKRSATKQANRYLAGLLLVIAWWNASVLIWEFNLFQYGAGIVWIPMTFTLALGPCYYFYVQGTAATDHLAKRRVWPHFIPVMVEVMLFLAAVFQGLPKGQAFFQTELHLLTQPVVTFVAIAAFLVYSILANKSIRRYHHWVKQNYSHFHKYNLNWLNRLSLVLLVVLSFWTVYFLLAVIGFAGLSSMVGHDPFHVLLSVVSIWLSVEAFLQPDIIYPEQVRSSAAARPHDEPPSEAIKDQAAWLQQQIKTNKLYLDPELSLRSLAATLDLHPNHVSKVINEGLGQSFSDCINQWRVAEVIKQLHSEASRDHTLLSMAFESGFNSKTTFNRVFKSHVGVTPTQFKKNLEASKK
ncbi:helix-turn-helix domain-containing protein [Marinicella meishanensis]|uniref:helix-turn-helix domain-containing protein n=1 Tax=Marinicella meishanensis TaxID=2873263 RepID=UPI001CC03C7B|nr:AraC family transcriptional regulator [Marinicella sp. NBU2979]